MAKERISELVAAIKPYVIGWLTETGVGAGDYAPSPHALSGPHHTGSLTSAQYPDALLRDGTRSLIGNLAVADAITIDGVDLSAFKTDYDAHITNPSAHHTAFIGLRDDATTQVAPDGAGYIQVAGGNGIVTAAGTNVLTVSADIGDGLEFATAKIAAKLGTGLTFATGAIVLNWSGTPTTIQPDDSAGGGSSSYAARIDHRHAIVTAAPGTIQPDDTASEGSATSFARSDHRHAIAAGTPGTIYPDDAAAEGTATSFARSDHRHAIAAAAASTVTPELGNSEGTATSFARSDHIHNLPTDAPTTNLSVSSNNTEGAAASFARSNHMHAITTSYNPGATASILASSMSGYLALVGLGIGTLPTAQEIRADGDLVFVGAQQITNTTGVLTLSTGDDDLLLSPADDVLTDSTVATDNWVSGLNGTGWGISYAGAADFRSIFTEELRTYAFTAEIYSALAGALVITKSRTRVSRDFTIPATSGSATLYVEDLEGIADTPAFTVNDYVQLRVWDTSGGGLVIANVYGQVTAYSDLTGGEQSWTFTTTTTGYSSAHVIYRGAVVLDYGQPGSGSQGVWSATVLDTAGSPYSEVQTWSSISSGEPSGFTTWVRTGNLDGLSGVGLEYGLYAGTGLTTTDAYVLVTSAQVALHNLPLEVHNGTNPVYEVNPTTPYYALGNPRPTAFATGTGVWAGNDGGTYKWRVGDPAGVRLSWDGTQIYLGDTGARHLKVDASAIGFYDSTTKRAELTSTQWTLGTTSGSHIVITPTSVQIKEGAQAWADLTGSVLTLGAKAEADPTPFMQLSDAGLEIYSDYMKVVDIQNNGDFIFGENVSGKSNLFYDESEGRLNFRGYGTVQAYVDTDGSIVAGTGAVTLDATGATFKGTVLYIQTADGTPIGNIAGDTAGLFQASPCIRVQTSSDTANRAVEVTARRSGYETCGIVAKSGVDADYVWVIAGSSLVVVPTGATFSNDVYIGEGLHVGGTSDPGMNNAIVDGNLDAGGLINRLGTSHAYFLGGIHVGGTSDPGDDNLIVDGTSTLAGTVTIGGGTNVLGGAYAYFLGGIHVGSSGDPGDDNLIVDGDITFSATFGIKSTATADYILKDHGNGNVTLSATGGMLYLGYQNTSSVYVPTGTYLWTAGGIHVGGSADPGTDMLLVDGDYQAMRGAVARTGGIVEFPAVGVIIWTEASRVAGTTNIDVDNFADIPTLVKAVYLRMSHKVSSPGDANYFGARPYGQTNSSIMAKAQVANVRQYATGWVKVDTSGRFALNITGSAAYTEVVCFGWAM